MKYFPATNHEAPKIVVGLTTYNEGQYIVEALDSVLQQDFQDFLIIIADDASDEETINICKTFYKKYPDKIALILHDKNQGVVANKNSIFPYIPEQTKYFAYFDADDIYLPSKFTKQIELMEKNPNIVASYHDVWVRENDTGVQYRYNNRWVGQPAHQGDVFKKLIIFRCFISALSVVVRWDICKNLTLRDSVGFRADWLYFIEIAKYGDVGYLAEPLGVYRRHGNNVTREYPNITSEYLIYDYLYKNYPDMRSAIDKGLIGTYLAYAVKYLLVGDVSYTAKYSLRMILLSLKSPRNFLYLFITLPLTFFRRLLLLLQTGKINR